MINLPFIQELAFSLIDDRMYGNFTTANLMFSFLFMVFVAFYSIPYGKNYQRGRSFLKIEIPDRPAFILANIFGPLLFILLKLTWPNGNLLNIESFLYIAHYIHRALIYPFFRSKYSKPWPLESFLYYTITNICEGIIVARAQTFMGINRNIMIQILLALLVIVCAVLAAIHDYRICSLRSSTDTGYKIPQGLCFKWVSGPNYSFEILEWAFYCCFLGANSSMVAFGMWHLVNLTGRAEATHRWYQSFFKSKLPQDRTPYIPFIKDSKFFL